MAPDMVFAALVAAVGCLAVLVRPRVVRAVDPGENRAVGRVTRQWVGARTQTVVHPYASATRPLAPVAIHSR